jgi:hypothetical protein
LDNKFKNAETKLEIFLQFLSKIDISKLNVKFNNVEIEGGYGSNNSADLLKILNLSDLKRPINALKTVLQSNPIYIFIDELDTGWNNTKEAKNFISGLISATLKINSLQNVSAFLSLRHDMFNNLSEVFNDAEKIRGQIEFIKWDVDQLKGLICERIKDNEEVQKLYKLNGHLSYNEILGLVFEDGAFEYLVENTLHRPREIINFSNSAIEKYSDTYQSRYLFEKRIDKETIDIAAETFCQNRFNDFCAEYNYEYPNIRDLLINFEGAKAVNNKNDFLSILEDGVILFSDGHTENIWINSYMNNPEKLMIKLFEIGFLKISVSNLNDFFAYYERRPLNYKNVKYVRVNNVFARALNCTRMPKI